MGGPLHGLRFLPLLSPCLECGCESGSGHDLHPAAAHSGTALRQSSGSGLPLLDDRGSDSLDLWPAAARPSARPLHLEGRDEWG